VAIQNPVPGANIVRLLRAVSQPPERSLSSPLTHAWRPQLASAVHQTFQRWSTTGYQPTAPLAPSFVVHPDASSPCQTLAQFDGKCAGSIGTPVTWRLDKTEKKRLHATTIACLFVFCCCCYSRRRRRRRCFTYLSFNKAHRPHRAYTTSFLSQSLAPNTHHQLPLSFMTLRQALRATL
jgi:hypothetical protein